MAKGGKKAKLVKQEREPHSKPVNEEIVTIVRQPPSPIPEEAESAFVAQGSAHDEPSQRNYWSVGANTGDAAPALGAWYASPRQSGAASPPTEDYGPTSWAGKSDSSSMSRDSRRRPSSPYPNIVSVDLDQDDTRSTGEGGLDYVSDERSGMDSNSNMQHQWNTAMQDQSQVQLHPPPQMQQEHPQKPPPTGPSFNVYAMSFSNPPVAPNPLPAPPNVVSKASDAAARIDRSKKGDLPPQPPLVFPLPPATWHNWIKPGTYAPKPEPPAPPPAPLQAPPPQPLLHQAPASGLAAGSIPKGPIHNSTRGIWDLKHGKGFPASTQMYQSRGRAHVASGQWSQPRSRSSVDGWATQPGGGGHGAWNEGGWGTAGESGGWSGNDGGNRGHGRSKHVGGWGRKQNVQWEEESSSEETDDDNGNDDGWGEHDTSGWEQDGGGQAQWPKPDNALGGWDQGGWNQGGGGLGHQSTIGYSWGEERKSPYGANAPLGAADKGVVSPQQKAQILNSLLNMSNMQTGQTGHAEHRTRRLASKRPKKESRPQTQNNAGWGWGDESWGNTHEDGNGDDDEEEEEAEEEHRPRASASKRVSTSWDAWGGNQEASRYSMPSLTLAHAYKDIKTRLDPGAQSKLDDFTRIRFHESRGAALVRTQNAFFGHARLARNRIHWSFPPDKDERVRAALTWVQEMTYGLATLGLHKYLQHRERGALFINADYRPPDRPQDFAVDYLTFDNLQYSRDQTLQVSVISYDPAMTVIVFVFLPSKTGNSIAIWRRKLLVPNNVRLRFQKELAIALAGLKNPEAYEVHVEENPRAKKDLPNPPKPGDQTKPKKKRKWWQFFKLFKS